MKESIYIIGASGLAKEVASYITYENKYDIAGFIDSDDEDDFLSKYHGGKTNIVIAVGYPDLRYKIAQKFMKIFDKSHFPNIIHPSVCFLAKAKLGIGNIIAPNCLISVDVKIGDFNLINYSSTIGHDVELGSYNVINPQTHISGNIKIGNQNLIGAGSAIIEKTIVGNGNTIGMGAVVIKDIDDNGKWAGVPVHKYYPPPP